ncbi:1-acyl-sn-glycerol-3-phosphate acyltransferase [Sphingomonas piscis]|uniref:1-acyl-sn-glycerol-3-phosphate acyltransferase n=2 Tax=Sphingomonas piscis TaxID=2714943 RepID=A0A6G7YTD8_9SPHN|nr:lysophospholipid acyltransferase family protein [Sphingomonas piscis]QIK80005.1 1-acyl-sn-glycerol-3-phosphate acyltransferase [Sphingomonas piscis]
MMWLRSLLFTLLFYPLTLVLVIAGIVASPFGTGPMRAVVHSWANAHHWLTRHLIGIRMIVEGEIPAEPMLIAIKHQAMFETVEALRLARTPVVVIKRELSDLPLFGWLTRRYGVIPVDREAGAKALRTMLTLGRQAIAAGRPIVIFPEGTRVPPGQTPPLRSGFAGLYRGLDLPVLPVAMDSGRLWGRGLLKRGGTIRFKVGEIIPSGLKRDEIEARVHAAINALEN